MKTFYLFIILTLSFLLTGCAPVSVNYDYDADFDFSTLKHYRWLEVPADFPANEIVINRIKSDVDQQLQAKGFQQVSESPDFLISMLGFRDLVRQAVPTGTVYSDYRYRSYRRYGDFERRFDTYEFEEGTLTLTVINAARSALIWEGTATMILEPDRSTEYKEQKTQEIIAKLLANFPPVQND